MVNRIGVDKRLCLVTIRLLNGAPVRVQGFGAPFTNREHPQVARWVNDNEPIVDGITLRDFLQRDEFHLLVPQTPAECQKHWDENALSPPFSYLYGTEHHWDLDRYKKLLEESKDKERFRGAYM